MTFHRKNNSKFERYLNDSSHTLLEKYKKCRHLYRNLTGEIILNHSSAIFTIGSGRSGTDALVDSLNQSLDVKLTNETNPLAFENWRLKELGVVKHSIETSGAPIVILKPIVETMRIQELLDFFQHSQAIFIYRHYNDANIRAVTSWVKINFGKHPQVLEELRDKIKSIWENHKLMGQLPAYIG